MASPRHPPGDDELKTNVDTITEKFNDLLDQIESERIR